MRRRIGTAVATALMFGAFAFVTGGVAHATVGSTPPATPQIGGSPRRVVTAPSRSPARSPSAAT